MRKLTADKLGEYGRVGEFFKRAPVFLRRALVLAAEDAIAQQLEIDVTVVRHFRCSLSVPERVRVRAYGDNVPASLPRLPPKSSKKNLITGDKSSNSSAH